jgi:hypothetical protein
VQLQRPIFGSLGNGTTIQHPQTGAYVLPCDLMQPKDTALTLTLGGTEFGVQFRDIMYVDIDYGTVSAGQSADCKRGGDCRISRILLWGAHVACVSQVLLRSSLTSQWTTS